MDEQKAQKIVGERFTIISELGRGGYGVVYVAKWVAPTNRADDEVALKVLLNSEDENDKDRFRHEIKQMSEFGDCPAIVPVLEAAPTHEEHPWYAMPLAMGTLRERGPELTELECVEVALDVAEALARIQDSNFVHRDITPLNILWFPKERRWKLADFGLARPFERSAASKAVTRTGARIGTETWMSPEQYLGVAILSEKSDIFSLGQVLGWLASGATPAAGVTTALSESNLFADLVRQMTDRNVESRPSLHQVREELLRIEARTRAANRGQWGATKTGEKLAALREARMIQLLRQVLEEECAFEDSLLGAASIGGIKVVDAKILLGMAEAQGMLSRDYDSYSNGRVYLTVTKRGMRFLESKQTEADLQPRP